MPLKRATMEISRSLYTMDSTLRRLDENGEYKKTIGKGLFSRLGYKNGDEIVNFVGVFRTQQEYMELCLQQPGRKAYSLAFSEKGLILDCYDQYKDGLCLASYANCFTGCWNTATNKKAVPNARLCVNLVKKTMKLRAGVKKGRESPANFFIPPHTEIVWDYESSYISYDYVEIDTES